MPRRGEAVGRFGYTNYSYTSYFTHREWAWEFLRENANFTEDWLSVRDHFSIVQSTPSRRTIRECQSSFVLARWGLCYASSPEQDSRTASVFWTPEAAAGVLRMYAMEKAEQGIWPTKAPLGYTNVMGPDGKKIITPDPPTSQIIADLFEWYATGQHSIKDVAKKARDAGLIYRRTGAAVPASTIHNILRNRIYYGEYEWNGRIFRGRHEPLISHEVWERVQKVLYGRKGQKLRRSKWDFAFSGVVTCGHCGCAMVGEMKKGRYVYYHCTGFKGKCNEPYVREEILVEQFGQLLRSLSFDRSVLDVVCSALRDSHRDEKRDHETAIAALQADQERLQKRIHALYIDKLDGTIDQRFFERMTREWRDEQERCSQQIQRHQSADQSYLEEGARLLELAHQAEALFTDRGAPDKRRLLNFLLSISSWKDGALTARFREPFDLIVETAIFAAANPVRTAADLAAHPGWLGD